MNHSIGDNIKKLRKSKSMTQDQLAERLHVTHQAISSWETGKTQPDIEMLKQMAEVFDVTIEELTVDRVYRLELDDDPDMAKLYEEVILKSEQRWGYDALEDLEDLVRYGGFKVYNSQDYRATQEGGIHGGSGVDGETISQNSGVMQERTAGTPNARRNVSELNNPNGDLQDTETAVLYTPEDAQMSLPSKHYLRKDVSAWRKAKRAETQREEESRKGERQFVKKTLQNSRAMPSYIRQTLFNDPSSRFYDRDSNDEQIIRAYETVAQEGKEAAIERILSSREMPTKDEIAQANVLMAQAAHDGDMSTLLALSRHYAEDTTEVAQALQAMKIFKRMTPAGAMSAAAAQNEALLSGYIEGHAPVRQEVEAEARRVSEDIEDKDGRDPIALLGSGETTLTRENSKWGIPINERQEALIKHYKLENVTRPGIHYNRATVKQRMLEAILATPDPLEATNEGMTLVTRLEYMKKGAPVITNADLEYIGRQLAIYTSMDADSQSGREGQLALARAYEANANITQAGTFEKINGARFINMLLNLTSPTRNVMGNVLQTSVNSASTGMMADYAEHAFKDAEHKSAAGWFATRAKNRLSALERDWHDVHDELKQGHHDDDLIDALACHVDHSIADLKARIDKM